MVLQWKERWNCKLLTPLNNLLLQSRNSYSVWHLQLSYEIFKIRHFEMFRWIIHLLITQLPIQSASYTILMKLFKKRCFEKIPWIIPLFIVEFSIKPDSYMYTSLWGKKKNKGFEMIPGIVPLPIVELRIQSDSYTILGKLFKTAILRWSLELVPFSYLNSVFSLIHTCTLFFEENKF